MRYYNLTITPPNGSKSRTWTTHPQPNVFDPGALTIEFDVFVYPQATPRGGSTITLYGVTLSDLTQAKQFTGWSLALKAGMAPGLPLATKQASKAGLLLQGQIFQSFGNWVGTEMALTFVVNPTQYTPNTPGNFSISWPAKTTLNQALAQTFTNAFPGVKQNISISPNLVFSFDESGAYSTLQELSGAILAITEGALGPNYPGVLIWMDKGQIYASDQSMQGTATQLDFIDLIGQPTWILPAQIQTMTVMRADLSVNSYILMPQGLPNAPGAVQTAASSLPGQQKNSSIFQGRFVVSEVRHVGHLRDPSGASWSSTFNCVTAGT